MLFLNYVENGSEPETKWQVTVDSLTSHTTVNLSQLNSNWMVKFHDISSEVQKYTDMELGQ